VLGGVDSGGVYILSFYCSFRGFATFHAFYWSCGFSFFYMVFLSFSLAFGHLAVLHGVLDSRFKLCAFCCQWTHQGEDCETKWSVLWFDCDESLTW
jgi:hypothetical protein